MEIHFNHQYTLYTIVFSEGRYIVISQLKKVKDKLKENCNPLMYVPSLVWQLA